MSRSPVLKPGLQLFLEITPGLKKRPAGGLQANFLQILYPHISSLPGSVVDINGLPTSWTFSPLNYRINAPSANSLWGLLLGANASPVDIEDYKLQAKINHGAGAGELTHAAVTFSAGSRTNNSYQIAVNRTFTNNGGATVTAREAALYFRFDATWTLMLAREVFVPIPWSPTQVRTVTWTFSISA